MVDIGYESTNICIGILLSSFLQSPCLENVFDV